MGLLNEMGKSNSSNRQRSLSDSGTQDDGIFFFKAFLNFTYILYFYYRK